jgi:hypothetical protein
MVAHHRVREHIDPERGALPLESLRHPLASMIDGIAAEKRSAHAATDQVIGAAAAAVDQV